MKALIFALLGAVSVSACAQGVTPVDTGKPAARATAATATAARSPAAEAKVRAVLKGINPKIAVQHVAPSPIPGFQQAIVGGQVVYVSDDGKYLMQGRLFDVAKKEDLSEVAMESIRADLLKTIPAADRIRFAPANPKYTVAVLTDVECGYCRKFHSEIAQINQQGIAVEYIAFPRMGLNSPDYQKMVSVWCAADRGKALTDAKSDRPVPTRTCANPVAKEYQAGQDMGLTGTPMILTADGKQLGGYLPPAELRKRLDELAKGGSPAASGATDPAKPAGA